MEEHQQRASNGLNGVKSAETPKTKPDPSQAEKFMFRNDMAKPGAEYLEAKMSEKEHQRPDAHFRLFSTQHRFARLSVFEKYQKLKPLELSGSQGGASVAAGASSRTVPFTPPRACSSRCH